MKRLSRLLSYLGFFTSTILMVSIFGLVFYLGQPRPELAFAQSSYPLQPFNCPPNQSVTAFNPVALGLPGFQCQNQSQLAAPTVALGLSATGSSQGTALPLAANKNQIVSTPFGSGVLLTAAIPGSINPTYVWNGGTNSLFIYPASGGSINGQPANVPISVGSGTLTILVAFSSSTWYAK